MSAQAPRQPRYREQPTAPVSEWDTLVADIWRIVGATTDPLLRGISVHTVDGCSEFISAALARKRAGQEPHK